MKIGVTEPRFIGRYGGPTQKYVRDSRWRPLDRNKDKPREIGDPFGKKIEELYYWYWN